MQQFCHSVWIRQWSFSADLFSGNQMYSFQYDETQEVGVKRGSLN